MSSPVPISVRIYNNLGQTTDQWLDEWLIDATYRSVIPGGFANATIVLANENLNRLSRMIQLYNRVQIVDTNCLDIVWEGRIESPYYNREDNTWEIGCLGAMAVASDIRRPMFYIDSSLDSWLSDGWTDDIFTKTVTPERKKIEVTQPSANTWLPGVYFDTHIWQRGEECDLYVGRFDATYAGSDHTSTPGRLASAMDVTEGGGANRDDKVDVNLLNSALVRKANRVTADFPSTKIQRVCFMWGNNHSTLDATTGTNNAYAWLIDPRVQVQRVNRFGNKLTAAADYPNEWLTVPQIVEDVVGRMLVKGWDVVNDNNPFPGQVRPTDMFIDTSATAKITHLAYWDGVTAAQILNDLVEQAQPEAYWAVWESTTKELVQVANVGFRFEWAKWPTGAGYSASSEDLNEQPDGSSLYNYAWLKHSLQTNYSVSETAFQFLDSWWWTSENQESNNALRESWTVRGETLIMPEPIDHGPAATQAANWLRANSRVKSTGTLTVSKPLHCYDSGDTGYSGINQMVEPHRIRPGKLVQIVDMPVSARTDSLVFGTSSYPREHEGSMYKMTATEYNLGNNTCTIELDLPNSWNAVRQIAKSQTDSNIQVIRG